MVRRMSLAASVVAATMVATGLLASPPGHAGARWDYGYRQAPYGLNQSYTGKRYSRYGYRKYDYSRGYKRQGYKRGFRHRFKYGSRRGYYGGYKSRRYQRCDRRGYYRDFRRRYY